VNERIGAQALPTDEDHIEEVRQSKERASRRKSSRPRLNYVTKSAGSPKQADAIVQPCYRRSAGASASPGPTHPHQNQAK